MRQKEFGIRRGSVDDLGDGRTVGQARGINRDTGHERLRRYAERQTGAHEIAVAVEALIKDANLDALARCSPRRARLER